MKYSSANDLASSAPLPRAGNRAIYWFPGARTERMAAGEITALVTDATPYLSAALSAYGAAVLTKVRDDAADATIGVGRRFLQRVFGRRSSGEPMPAVLAEVIAAPGDADALGALRLAIRRELETDAEMLADVRQILAAGEATVHSPTIRSGRDTYYSARDMTINRPAD
jgi:hypothetical protein